MNQWTSLLTLAVLGRWPDFAHSIKSSEGISTLVAFSRSPNLPELVYVYPTYIYVGYQFWSALGVVIEDNNEIGHNFSVYGWVV